MELVLGIDLGTSYFKLGLFTPDGQLKGLARVPVPARIGPNRTHELTVPDFIAALKSGIAQALHQADARPPDIKAVGYSSQANSFLLLDENDHPLTPLILWPDQRPPRVPPAIEQLARRDDFLSTTGLGLDIEPGFAMAKLAWLRTEHPDLWSRVRRIQTISDYLVYLFTGQPQGDQGTASLLGMWSLPAHRWWPEALAAVGIDPAQLSCPLPPGRVAAMISPQAAQTFPLPDHIPLAVGSLDHHVAAIGAGVGQTADYSESTGTVLCALRYTEHYTPRPHCCLGPADGRKLYYQFAFDGNGAATLQWYQQTHAPHLTIPQLTSLAAAVPPGSDGLIARPSARQYPNFDGFLNRTPQHTPAHFARAILESTAAGLWQLIDTLAGADRPTRIIATGGGAQSDLWLQIKADLLDVEFVAPECPEPACAGAALFAAVAAGWFAHLRQAQAAWIRIARTFSPDPDRHDFYRNWRIIYQKAINS